MAMARPHSMDAAVADDGTVAASMSAGEWCHRSATRGLDDLRAITDMLLDDPLGAGRDAPLPASPDAAANDPRVGALDDILRDPRQYLMVVTRGADGPIVGTCHLRLLRVISHGGALKLNVEAVRVVAQERGRGIGEWMMRAALEWGRSHGAHSAELTSAVSRVRARGDVAGD